MRLDILVAPSFFRVSSEQVLRATREWNALLGKWDGAMVEDGCSTNWFLYKKTNNRVTRLPVLPAVRTIQGGFLAGIFDLPRAVGLHKPNRFCADGDRLRTIGGNLKNAKSGAGDGNRTQSRSSTSY
jgi:hypothetical protein